jgi:hypothetical protein
MGMALCDRRLEGIKWEWWLWYDPFLVHQAEYYMWMVTAFLIYDVWFLQEIKDEHESED